MVGVVLGACGGGEDEVSRAGRGGYLRRGRARHVLRQPGVGTRRWTRRSTPSSPTRPTENLDAAKEAWLTARDEYGPTEAFRFYGGPIDNEETGVEGLVNAWPLDEAYIDYVDGDPEAGIVNNPDEHPTIDADALVAANEQGGEANVSTGWHAIEFLLWGQDLSADGPGARPVEDYTTSRERRPSRRLPRHRLRPARSSTWTAWWPPGPPTTAATTAASSWPSTRTRRWR